MMIQYTKSELRTLAEFGDDAPLHAAAIQFEKLKDRAVHPEGRPDPAGRFYLTDGSACCDCIRAPSRNHPFSQLLHGRTAVHVAYQYGIPHRTGDIHRYLRLMKKHPELRSSPTIALSILANHQARQALEEIEGESPKRRTAKAPRTPAVAADACVHPQGGLHCR